MTKRCFKCLRDLPVEEFYRHPAMADGRLGKCRDCTRQDVKRHRIENLDRVRAYDRERAKQPHVVQRIARVAREWRAQHPERARAQQVANNAIRDKKITKPNACEGCGRETALEKHHHDYSRPLLIVWLCKPCHAIADKIRRKLEAS